MFGEFFSEISARQAEEVGVARGVRFCPRRHVRRSRRGLAGLTAEALSAGIHVFLPKPYTAEKLLHAIAEILARVNFIEELPQLRMRTFMRNAS
jgi:DNA-binding NarL/FixJ family response regulator